MTRHVLFVRRERASFTILELMVAIAIISILLSFLFPALKAARERASMMSCLNNLRQIYVSMDIYANENEERYPEARGVGTWGVTNSGWVGWLEALHPYLNSPKIYRCPGQPLELENPYSYFLGCHAVYVAITNTGTMKRSEITLSSQYILAGDTTMPWGDPFDTDKDNYNADCLFSTPGSAQRVARYHAGRANILFGDGHVKAYNEFVPLEMSYSYTQPGTDY